MALAASTRPSLADKASCGLVSRDAVQALEIDPAAEGLQPAPLEAPRGGDSWP